MSQNPIEKFQYFLEQNNIPTDEPIEFDRLVKYDDPERKALGKRRAPRHYYIAFLNESGHIWAKCGTHSTSFEVSNPIFKSYKESDLSADEIASMRSKIKEGQRKEEEDLEAQRLQGIVWANKIWNESIEIDENFHHEWLEKKRLAPIGIRYHEKHDKLIIPAYNIDGLIQSYQRIARDGTKKNGAGCVMRHCFHTIGDIEKSHTIYVGESWSTCMPAHLASGQAAVATFGSGALPFIGKTLQNRYPDKTVCMLKDKGDAGDKAAKDWQNLVKTEIFEASEDDFSHLYATYGLDRVKEELKILELPLFTPQQILDKDIPPIKWVVENMYSERSVNIKWGDAGCGKTFKMMDMCEAIARGRPIFDMDVPDARKVFYLDGELGEALLQERLRDMNQRLGSLSPNIHFMPYDSIEENVNIADSKWQAYLDPIIEQHDVIVFDNWYALSSTVEAGSQNIVWKAAFKWMKRWSSKDKCFIVLHHAVKEGGMRGSSDMFNDCDSIIQVEANPNLPTHLSIQVTYTKGRRVKPQYKLPYQIDLINGDWSRQKPEPPPKKGR